MQAARLGHNQSIVRSLNEESNAGFMVPSAPFDKHVAGFLCECSDLDCSALIYVPVAKYQEVRGDARRFLVRPGHEIPAIEHVVDRAESYHVVEKVGSAAEQVTQDAK